MYSHRRLFFVVRRNSKDVVEDVQRSLSSITFLGFKEWLQFVVNTLDTGTKLKVDNPIWNMYF